MKQQGINKIPSALESSKSLIPPETGDTGVAIPESAPESRSELVRSGGALSIDTSDSSKRKQGNGQPEGQAEAPEGPSLRTVIRPEKGKITQRTKEQIRKVTYQSSGMDIVSNSPQHTQGL